MNANDSQLVNAEHSEVETSSKGSLANKVIKTILSTDEITLFHDNQDNGWIEVRSEEATRHYKIRSGQFIKWLNTMAWSKFSRPLSGDALKSTQNMLEAHASHDGEEREVFLRSAYVNSEIWYDLCNKAGEVVHITQDGWRVTTHPKVVFRKMSVQAPQVRPCKDEADLKKVNKYLPFDSYSDKELCLTWLCTAFISNIPRYMMYLYGTQGGAKSTTTRFLKELVDPSILGQSQFPEGVSELTQALDHSFLPAFDNTSYVNRDVSNVLCRAITGLGFSKRKLYSDDSDIIYTFKRVIIINGINMVLIKPDLLDRTLLLNLKRIPAHERKTEEVLFKEFNEDKPAMLAGIFNTLAYALKHVSSCKSTEGRLADASRWGSVIYESMGGTCEGYRSMLRENKVKQDDEIIKNNPAALAVYTMMTVSGKRAWEGTPSQLFRQLKEMPEFADELPKGAGPLSRKLNELKVNLKNAGLAITESRGKSRRIKIQVTRALSIDDIDAIDGSNTPTDKRLGDI